MYKPKDPTRPTTIYALKDKVGSVFYIGQTMNLKQRLNSHRKRWPDLVAEVLEVVPNVKAVAVERRHILDQLKQGVKLENKSLTNPPIGVTLVYPPRTYPCPPRLKVTFIGHGSRSCEWLWDGDRTTQDADIAALVQWLDDQGQPGAETIIRNYLKSKARALGITYE